TLSGLDQEPVADEVEIDLEVAVSGRNRRSRQSKCGHVERVAPAVVERRTGTESVPDLSDDLQPEVERRVRVAPGLEGQLRPRFRRSGRALVNHGRSVHPVRPPSSALRAAARLVGCRYRSGRHLAPATSFWKRGLPRSESKSGSI